MKKDYLKKILNIIYILTLSFASFLNLSVNTNGSNLYKMFCYISILLGVINIILRFRKEKINLLFETILLFIVVSVMSFYCFNLSKLQLSIITAYNMGIAFIYFLTFYDFKDYKNQHIPFAIIILILIVFDVICLINSGGNFSYLKGISTQRNQLASFNVVGVMMLLSMLLHNKKQVLLKVGMLIFFVAIIMFTQSRTSIIVTLLAFVFALWTSGYNKIKNKKIYTISSLSVVLVTILLVIIFRDSILQMISRTDISNLNFNDMMNAVTTNRWGLWTETFPEVMRDHWLFGWGINGLRGTIPALSLYTNIINIEYLTFWHNFIVDIIFTSGIVGFGLFIAIIVNITYKVIKNYNCIKYIIFDISQILCMFALYLFDVEFIWHPNLLNLYFFIILGNILVKIKRYKKEYEK